MPDVMDVATIKVENRTRKELGDLDDLIASIRSVGLLHPIVVDESGRLIAGARRLEACKRIGMTEVPVHVVKDFGDATRRLIAERDENTCRLAMTPSERVEIGAALEEMERPKAAERKAATQAKPGHGRVGAENFTAPEKQRIHGETRDIIGAAVGMSGVTYQRAKAVVTATKSPDPKIRAAAEAAKAEMDSTGKVTPAYESVQNAIGEQSATRRLKSRSKVEQIRRVLGSIDAFNPFFASISQDEIDATQEERAEWRDTLSQFISAINRFRRLLKEVE